MFIYIFKNEGILETIFRCEMQCQNTRIKVFDSSLIRMNKFPFECLMYILRDSLLKDIGVQV
jgi:hypothetical protein